MKLTDKLKIGMAWLTLLALGCTSGSTIDKYKYPPLENIIYRKFIDVDKDGFPDIVLVGYGVEKDLITNFIARYRIIGTIRKGSAIASYKTQGYPLSISHHKKNGEMYLMQFDDDENGTIDRYKDIKLNKVIGKGSHSR